MSQYRPPYHIVIVCGYGCHLVPELKKYLDRVVDFCNRHEVEYIVFSGGYTQKKSAPNISEAHLMSDYVRSQLTYRPEFCLIDDNSYTSPDNIQYAAQSLRDRNLLKEDAILTFFCEATRALKIDMLVRHFFGRRATIETASWERMSPYKQLLATFYDLLAIKIPLLARYWRWKQIHRSYNM